MDDNIQTPIQDDSQIAGEQVAPQNPIGYNVAPDLPADNIQTEVPAVTPEDALPVPEDTVAVNETPATTDITNPEVPTQAEPSLDSANLETVASPDITAEPADTLTPVPDASIQPNSDVPAEIAPAPAEASAQPIDSFAPSESPVDSAVAEAPTELV